MIVEGREGGCGIEGVLHRGDAETLRKRREWMGGSGGGCESGGSAEGAETSRMLREIGMRKDCG